MAKAKEKLEKTVDAVESSNEKPVVKKNKNFAALLNKINLNYNKNNDENVAPIIATAGSIADFLKPKFLSTGVPELDSALGGGWAKSCVNSLTGDSGCGKTCLGLMAVVETQKAGGVAVWINAEPPFPYLMALLLGVDLDELYLINPKDYGEQIFDVLDELLYDSNNRITRGMVDTVIVDSINGLIPKGQVDSHEKNGYEGVTIGRRAAMLSKWLEQLAGRNLLRDNVCLINIAQMRTDINSYGAPTKMSGGLALTYFSKIITRIRKVRTESKTLKVKSGETPLGHTVECTVTKNNIVGKLGNCSYDVAYGIGVDDFLTVWADGMAKNVIVKNGRTSYQIHLPEEIIDIPGGIDNAKDHVRMNKELKDRIRAHAATINLEKQEVVDLNDIEFDLNESFPQKIATKYLHADSVIITPDDYVLPTIGSERNIEMSSDLISESLEEIVQ
jgi:recombination protein RecA